MAVCECSAWVLALLCWDVLCHQEHGSCTGTVGVQLGVRVVEVITSPGCQQMKKMSCCPQSAQPPLLAASVVEDEVRGRAYSQLQMLAESSVPTGNQVEEVKAQSHQLGEWLRGIPLPPWPVLEHTVPTSFLLSLGLQQLLSVTGSSHRQPCSICAPGTSCQQVAERSPLRCTVLWVPCVLPASNQLSLKAELTHTLDGFQEYVGVPGR